MGVRRVLSLVVGVVMGWGVAARLARLREQKRRAGRRHGTSPSDCLYHTHSLALSALTRLLRRSLPRLSLTDEITKYRTPNTSSLSPASWPSSSPSTGAPSQRRAREVPVTLEVAFLTGGVRVHGWDVWCRAAAAVSTVLVETLFPMIYGKSL